MVILIFLKLSILDTVKHDSNEHSIISVKKYFCITYSGGREGGGAVAELIFQLVWYWFLVDAFDMLFGRINERMNELASS